jgi:hypothetical protein
MSKEIISKVWFVLRVILMVILSYVAGWSLAGSCCRNPDGTALNMYVVLYDSKSVLIARLNQLVESRKKSTTMHIC